MTATETVPAEQFYEALAEFCKGQAHPKRLMILHLLMMGEKSVGEIVQALKIEQPTVSQHLSFMKRTGVVKSRRVGNTVYYSLADLRVAQACHLISQIVKEKLAAKQ
ncbi:MAG: metalloregulator ArsR/SmtB family transcription factor [Candidatus Caldarchaeum sp.]|nr:metalloregulator ArsR/SmtB family transcription factor [Candidatus Caldarchaeum sp.]MCX8200621.1 metalloregulator ArsR/SmtB family transcription factor [Candidatus Caldarchaeum sp.]MDW8063849.1 metalloregulator ArsR/SmtB family transcription factor [Candidatus Caldarchaeum sp.]MDW8435314.1 metalloregulator ArsR/SmtB family transcription factor [Candidatus Caldarchaeum sp.]